MVRTIRFTVNIGGNNAEGRIQLFGFPNTRLRTSQSILLTYKFKLCKFVTSKNWLDKHPRSKPSKC